MNVADFDYQLPSELIAQHPASKRSESRLLQLGTDGNLFDKWITDIVDLLESGDLLVLNNTRVIPARLFGRKASGGRVEILLERVLNERQFLAQIRASKSPGQGQVLFVDGDESVSLTMRARQGSFFVLELNQHRALFDWFEKVGHMPLPPYIEREDQIQDGERYQTVFADQLGAVAAPTAGLHYDEALLAAIRDKGVQIETVTLHVGAGTYQPVRVDAVEDHVMHSEWIDVDQSVCDAVLRTRQAGKRIVAVGTTVVRSLETAARAAARQGLLIQPYQGDTDIFIYPGFQFNVVDALQTNFHLPQSTLLMLVSAFAGRQPVMRAYQHAIHQKYRFFSYGDAMWLERSPLS